MQIASSRIWTWVNVSISYNDNYYIICASSCRIFCSFCRPYHLVLYLWCSVSRPGIFCLHFTACGLWQELWFPTMHPHTLGSFPGHHTTQLLLYMMKSMPFSFSYNKRWIHITEKLSNNYIFIFFSSGVNIVLWKISWIFFFFKFKWMTLKRFINLNSPVFCLKCLF